ncbi:MAG TPA: ketoacyl-synthetase C-terminal extension domain-containing protein [Micromonosporaceae bacterium]|nr:ketoacyl-synthetase C-terminal extension domain-containing protein [Micromonosporaceae bacterium]
MLCLKHRELVPSLNFTTPHPQIPLAELNLGVQTTLNPWVRPGGTLVAGVSSFGMGGTNCHVVLSGHEPRDQDGPAPASSRGSASGHGSATVSVPAGTARPTPVQAGVAVLPCVPSGRSGEALQAQAQRLRAHLADHPELTRARSPPRGAASCRHSPPGERWSRSPPPRTRFVPSSTAGRSVPASRR